MGCSNPHPHGQVRQRSTPLVVVTRAHARFDRRGPFPMFRRFRARCCDLSDNSRKSRNRSKEFLRCAPLLSAHLLDDRSSLVSTTGSTRCLRSCSRTLRLNSPLTRRHRTLPTLALSTSASTLSPSCLTGRAGRLRSWCCLTGERRSRSSHNDQAVDFVSRSRHIPSIAFLEPEEKEDLAKMLGAVGRRFDNLCVPSPIDESEAELIFQTLWNRQVRVLVRLLDGSVPSPRARRPLDRAARGPCM